MSKDDRIKDLPSYKDLASQIEGVESLSALWPLLRLLRLVKTELPVSLEKIQSLKAQADDLITLPDRFNDAFAARGWVAYENLNLEVMKSAAEYAETGRTEQGEQELIEYYQSEENLRFCLMQMKAVRSWMPRAALAEKAKRDYLEGRYHASVPVVLALMDGLVSDVATTGFFAQGTEMEAWDSVAGHSTGLGVICKIFNKGRRKTTSEPIDQPYRHGIMHGRDLGYDNKLVATKCWAALFAIREWALKYDAAQSRGDSSEKEEGLWESLRGLADIGAQLQENREVKRQLSEWKARDNLQDVLLGGIFEEGSPEQVAEMALRSWKRGNYGAIAKLISRLSGKETLSKRAGRIRSQIEPKLAEEFEILAIKDQAAAISIIAIRVVGQTSFAEENEELFFGLRMSYEDSEARPVIRGRAEGSWKVIEASLYRPRERAELMEETQNKTDPTDAKRR